MVPPIEKGPGNRRATKIGHAARLTIAAIGIAAALEPGAAGQDRFGDRSQQGSWTSWGGNVQNGHSSQFENKVNAANAGSLTQKWVFQTAGDVSATPTVDGGSVYVPDWGGYIYRIDAQTGKAIWSHKVADYTGNSSSWSRNSPAIGPDQIVFGDQALGTLLSVNKNTGNLIWQTTLDSAVSSLITSSPVIVGNRVYVGVASLQEGSAIEPGFQLTFRGSVAALDLATGAVLWQTYTVPVGYTGGAVWGSSVVVDQRRNSLFATTGNNYSIPASAVVCLLGAGTSPAMQLGCLDPTDYLDSVLALDLQTGKIKWAHQLEGADTWLASCVLSAPGGTPCPQPAGPDYDFGSGANMIRTEMAGKSVEAIGAGQKSGMYWALNPDTGAVLWSTLLGPGGDLGGIEFGSATDNKRVYTAINDTPRQNYLLQPQNTQTWSAGSWAALDAGTGAVLWQVPVTGQNALNPAQAAGAEGQVTVANGVFYAGSLSGDMVALDASNGNLLWKFASGGSVVCGPSIVDGTLYWGSGYSMFGAGVDNNKLYAFSLPGGASGQTPSRTLGTGSTRGQ